MSKLDRIRDALAAAVQAVDWARFCLDATGRQIPQTSSVEMITRMLQLLGLEPGQRVLEIGTGSGYSTALLAELVGPSGSIVSIDIDPRMTQRATRLLPDVGCGNVHLLTGDGRRGCPARAPFDYLIAWASATRLPTAWRDQTRPDAVLVVPMRRQGRMWISKFRRTEDGSVVEDERIAGGFIPLTRTPFNL
jgi:protein-L-isoaspartate(D-aspartate) O-methyltransferase